MLFVNPYVCHKYESRDKKQEPIVREWFALGREKEISILYVICFYLKKKQSEANRAKYQHLLSLGGVYFYDGLKCFVI